MPKAKKSIQKFSQKLKSAPKISQTISHSQVHGFWSWLDNNLLLILSAFLFSFIPIFPKIPLADIIPGYLVRLRLEDLFVASAVAVYGIQILRKKAEWKTPFTWIIVAYAIVGMLSTLSAVLITKTIPAEPLHIGKSLLHYFRYLEYFSLFFLVYSSVKTRAHVRIFSIIFMLTVITITLYGYGQKFYYWPVYSTMNREFSKGVRLYLTEHARVQSTFGGHYDMAGYLVIALPILLALGYGTQHKVAKIMYFAVFIIGLWLLIMSASRTSFAAFMIGISAVVGLYSLLRPTWLERIRWGITRGLLLYTLVIVMFMTYGESIEERFVQVLKGYPVAYENYEKFKESKNQLVNGQFDDMMVTLGLAELKLPEPEIPQNAISTAQLEEQVLVTSDERPTTTRPTDVYIDVPDIKYVASESADGTATGSMQEVPRTWSDCSLKYGLSLCIRYDTLWPRAIAGFKKNPLVGSGYATLTKQDNVQFTEAESTDNNFLRTLGETGLLGFVTFYGTILISTYFAIKGMLLKDVIARALSVGLVGATVGLLFNAVYIDVFAASKIAFTYWAVNGFILAYLTNTHDLQLKNSK